MADPFAPPSDVPRRRTRAPAPASTYEQPAETSDWPEERQRSMPATPGPFWIMAAVGIAMVTLGRLILFFTAIGEMDGEFIAPAIFEAFGTAALSVGLALAAVLQRGLSMPVRTALMLGAGYFALSSSFVSLLSSFSRLF